MAAYQIRTPNFPSEEEIIEHLDAKDLLGGHCSHASVQTHLNIFKAGFGSGWSACVDEVEGIIYRLQSPRRGWRQDDGWGE